MAKQLSTSELLETIGRNLHSIRNARKETLQAVAQAIGITHPVISKIENGRNENLSLALLVKLCNHYEVTLQQIMSLEISQIFQLTQHNGEGNHKLVGQESGEGYKEEIAYLRSLLEKHLIKGI
jgi:transcriptional regulator with XRE-family HTH domain